MVIKAMDDIILILELIGTVAFAVSGAVAAMEKRLDLFGVLFCGITTALGGGTIRDTLLGRFPPVMFTDYIYLIFAVVTSSVTFIAAKILNTRFERNVKLINKVNNFFDAVGLGVFTVVGIDAAIKCGYSDNSFFVIVLGSITGFGGGILRDIIIRKIPMVFTERIYAVASLAGGTLYYLLLVVFDTGNTAAVSAAISLIFILRLLASVFRWDLPKAY